MRVKILLVFFSLPLLLWKLFDLRLANVCAPLVQTVNRVDLESLAGPNYMTKNGKCLSEEAE